MIFVNSIYHLPNVGRDTIVHMPTYVQEEAFILRTKKTFKAVIVININ